MNHFWRCPSCLYDFEPGEIFDSYSCFDCVAQCDKIDRCEECGEEAEECTCNPECSRCCAPLIVPEGETAYHGALCVDCAPEPESLDRGDNLGG